jgi:hypothetical protein
MASKLYIAARAFIEMYEANHADTLGKEYWELKQALGSVKAGYQKKPESNYKAKPSNSMSSKTLAARVILCQIILSSWHLKYSLNTRTGIICDCAAPAPNTGKFINIVVSFNHDGSIRLVYFRYAEGKNTYRGMPHSDVLALTKKFRKQIVHNILKDI